MRTITTTLSRRLLAATALLAVAFAAGCGGGDGTGRPSPSPLDPTDAARQRVLEDANVACLADRSPLVVITDATDNMTAAIEVGTGDTGVVLLHQAESNVCQWYPFALTLQQQGYRALSLDISSRDAIEVAQAGIAHLREAGVKRVFVFGASRGGTIALTASARTTPPVDGVVSLSAPTVYDADARTAVKSLAAPTIFAAGELEGGFTDQAKELYGLSVSKHKKLVLRPGADHGVALLGGDLDALLLSFLADPTTVTS
ncbi:alpha/beta hydrolase [Catellatospora tritici]|uniref:alpha/beta hydrolase n=1 Tax=Catellatospora tritici TaxID=2851566 RepID=UPI001C2CD309|nr:alpha/beta hydrolase [Catellatospora tritici]MBV1855449.1 alpha/beta hydrolase [Catellatospora tritici]